MAQSLPRPAHAAPARTRAPRMNAHHHAQKPPPAPHLPAHPLAAPGLTGHQAPAHPHALAQPKADGKP